MSSDQPSAEAWEFGAAPDRGRADAIVGSGWAFPVGLDPQRRVALVTGPADVEQAIRIILLTPKGQRPRRPEFGCAIHDLIFAPNTSTTLGLAEYYVREALALWEPRIALEAVTAAPDPEDRDGVRLLIRISYRLKATNDRRSLVFPFYRIPAE
jgi:uncharacterized protein